MSSFYDGAWAVQYLRSFSVHHRRRHVGDPAQHRGRAFARSAPGVRSRLGCSQRSRPRRPNVSGHRSAFVTDEGLTLSYEEFDTLADEAAVGLAELGVGEGDVVGLLLPSVPEHFVAYVAAAKLGALTAAVNPKLVQAERAAVLRAANPRVLVTTEELRRPDDPDGRFTSVVVEAAAHPAAVLHGVRRAGAPPRTPGK